MYSLMSMGSCKELKSRSHSVYFMTMVLFQRSPVSWPALTTPPRLASLMAGNLKNKVKFIDIYKITIDIMDGHAS
jgi:hypothetical protein